VLKSEFVVEKIIIFVNRIKKGIKWYIHITPSILWALGFVFLFTVGGLMGVVLFYMKASNTL